MSLPKGRVLRLWYGEDGQQLPVTQYLARDTTAMFADVEWSWVPRIEAAWIFDTHDDGPTNLGTPQSDATKQVAWLKTLGEDHAYPMVVEADRMLEADRLRRHNDRVAAAEASVAPRRMPPVFSSADAQRRWEEANER